MAETLRELVVALSLDSSHFSRNMRTINQQDAAVENLHKFFRIIGLLKGLRRINEDIQHGSADYGGIVLFQTAADDQRVKIAVFIGASVREGTVSNHALRVIGILQILNNRILTLHSPAPFR